MFNIQHLLVYKLSIMFVSRMEYFVVLITCFIATIVSQTIQQVKMSSILCILISLITFQTKITEVFLSIQNYSMLLLNGAFGAEDKQQWLSMMAIIVGKLLILLPFHIVIKIIIILTKKAGGGEKQDDGKERSLKIGIADVGTRLVVKNVFIVTIILSIIMALTVKIKIIT